MRHKDQKIFSESICIRSLKVEELKEILKNCYHINLSNDNDHHSNRTTSNQIENAFNMALKSLQENGYVLPYEQFIVKNEDSSYIRTAYMYDMVILAYMYKKVRNDRVKTEDMPISNSTRGIYMSRMEETAISQILGVSRTLFDSKIWYTKETKEGKVLAVQPESKKIPMNVILYQFYAGLLSTTTQNPFIDIKFKKEFLKYETVTKETIEEHTRKSEKDAHVLLKHAYSLNDEYQEALLTLFNVPGSIDLFDKMQCFNSINITTVKKYYEIFWKKMKCLYENSEWRINHWEKDDEVIRLCHKYLFEGLLASYYYSMASKLDDIYIYGLYPMSENLYCISRNAHGKLFINSIGKEYSYNTYVSKKFSVDEWTRYILMHTKYTVENFLPALYYLFIYYLELEGVLRRKEKKCELVDYITKNNTEIEKNFFNYEEGFNGTDCHRMELYYNLRKMNYLGYAKGVTKPLF